MFKREGEVAHVVRWLGSARFGDDVTSPKETRVGALALRGIILPFEDGEGNGGTEIWRGFAALRVKDPRFIGS